MLCGGSCAAVPADLCRRLMGRPASETGRLRYGNEAHRGGRPPPEGARVLMLAILCGPPSRTTSITRRSIRADPRGPLRVAAQRVANATARGGMACGGNTADRLDHRADRRTIQP